MDDWEYWTPEEHERLIENMSAWMDGELPDIANTPEAGGPDDLELEVAEHQACCPSCRALFGELKELRAGFEALPEPDPPEGFAQGVMERIRREEAPKVVPLFQRPRFKALAGLAACLAVVVGIYGAARPHNDIEVRSFKQDALTQETDGTASLEDTPQITAYAAPTPEDGETTEGVEKAAPNPAADGMEDDRPLMEGTTTLERMPKGGWELIPPETAVMPMDDGRGSVYLDLPLEVLDEIERLAQEQGIGVTAERCSAPGAEVVYNLEILQPDQ